MRMQWAVGEWGPACGPRPETRSVAGGFLDLQETGSELVATSGELRFSTRSCWETQHELWLAQHTASRRAWSSLCRTAETAPRQVVIQTRIRATDDSIHLDETGQYVHTAEGQSCTASSRRTQHLRLVERRTTPRDAVEPDVASHAGADASSSPELARAAPAAVRDRCKRPGPPKSLRVTPSAAWLLPGQSAQLSAELRDEAGCSLKQPAPEWSLSEPRSGIDLRDATLSVGSDAEEGNVTVVARVGGLARTVELRVLSSERYDALLAEANHSIREAAEQPAQLPTATLDSPMAVAEDRATRRKYWFASFVGLAALALGGLGTLVMQKVRQTPHLVRVPPVLRRVPSRICPTCGSMYGSEAQFCGKDGSYLVSTNNG